MADVKMIDIDSEQWNIKDQVARDTLTEQEVKINNLQENLSSTNNKIYVNNSKKIDILETGSKWFKIGNIYPKSTFSPNVFLIGTRRAGVYLLSCSRDDRNDCWPPVLIRFYDSSDKIISAKAKGEFAYIRSAGWNSINIQQLSGISNQITLIEEEPPKDAIDITIIKN